MDKIYDKLTEAAKSALTDILKDYEDKILNEAYLNAAQNNTQDIEITLSDVMSAKKRLFNKGPKDKIKNKKRKLYFYTLLFACLIYALLGVVLLLKEHYQINLKKDVGLILILVSVFTSLFSVFVYMTSEYRKKILNLKKNENEKLDSALLNRWSRIEYYGKVLIGIYMTKLSESDASKEDKEKLEGVKTYADLINKLLDQNMQDSFKRSLKVRNMIAHGESDLVSHLEKADAIELADIVARKLRNIIKKETGEDDLTIDSTYNRFIDYDDYDEF